MTALIVLAAVMVSVGGPASDVDAAPPPYSGPTTSATGPAYFGPAPNAYPYCESPTYFDPFPENIDPIGPMDIGDTAAVTTDGTSMTMTVTADGPDSAGSPKYPGFFPFSPAIAPYTTGATTDRAKGVEFAQGDGAVVTLSKPLFYSQWVFTDVDQPNEGFSVVPTWTQVGEAAAFGGDDNFSFTGSSPTAINLDDTDGEAQVSESINGRVQVDFLGAVTGISFLRTNPSSGQSGFTVGGGCRAAGAAKQVVSGPTWNGSAFEVTYALRVRNNLPSSATIAAAVQAAQARVGASYVSGTPQGIPLQQLQLTDSLADPAFSSIVVTDIENVSGNLQVNPNYNGLTNINLLNAGSNLAAESEDLITLQVTYTPNLATPNWNDCQAGYLYSNQSEVSARAANVAVSDLSDDGIDAAPASDNGAGGVDDPTLVTFPCPPAGLQIVKTVVPGPNGTCPTFANGVAGPGTPLQVTAGDTVTYCISVRNPNVGTATNVVITDPQAPTTYTIGTLAGGQQATRSYNVVTTLTTPTTNTARATGNGPDGALPPVTDPAVIAVSPVPQPRLQIVKTVISGPATGCPDFAGGVPGDGPAFQVTAGDLVTYCIAVVNTGNGTATNVVITDPQAPGPLIVGTLAPGEEAIDHYRLAVTLNTPELNTATVNGNGPSGPLTPVSDTALISVAPPPEPGLQIVKTVVTSQTTCPTFDNGVPGDGPALQVTDGAVVKYCITVRNTGPGIATGVEVTDPQAPGDYSIGTLGVGASRTVSYTLTTSLTTPERNTATATGNGPSGPLDPVSDTALIAVSPRPEPVLEIVKTALRGPNATCPAYADGQQGEGSALQLLETQVVTYCLTVRNSGAGAAANVVITDDQAPGGSFNGLVGALAPGAEATRKFDRTVTVNTPQLNVATVNGTGPYGALPPDSDPARIAVSLRPDPVLEIVKTVVAGPNGTCPSFDQGTQGRGDALRINLGDTVTYCVSVRNTGQGDATTVRVTDDQAAGGPITVGALAAGATRDGISYDVVVGLSTPQVNIAVVTGVGPNGPVPSDSDDAVIDVVDTRAPNIGLVHSVFRSPAPCVSTTKALDSLVADLVGTPLRWCVEIINTGNTPLTNVVLNAPSIGILNRAVLAGTGSNVILPGASLFVDVQDTLRPGGRLSDAVVVADPSNAQGTPLNLAQVTDNDDAEARETSINIETTVVEGIDGDCADSTEEVTVEVGTDVTWCYVVTNTGTISLLVTEVLDQTLDILIPVPAGQQVMAPGDSFLVTSNGPVTNPFANVGVVEGQPLDNDGTILDQAPVVEDDDGASVLIRVADLAIVKSVSNAGPVPVGTVLTYTLVVTNNGPNEARGVAIDDVLPTGLTYTALPSNTDWVCSLGTGQRTFMCLKATTMASGASVELTYTVTMGANAPTGAGLVNTATVTSTTKDSDPTNNTDTASTSTAPVVTPTPGPTPLEYPGPFPTPTPVPAPAEPDEVLGLAITGSDAPLLGMLAVIMLTIGGSLMVGARRSRKETY